MAPLRLKPTSAWSLAAFLLSRFLGLAAEPAAAPSEHDQFFTQKVRPILEGWCWDCHSEELGTTKGELALDSLAGILRGGKSGEAALVPHNPKGSLMIAAIRRGNKELAMPPEAEEALGREEISVLEKWITLGAPWPGTRLADVAVTATRSSAIDETARQWWSLQPVLKPALPASSPWARGDIDRFIAQGHTTQNLSPAPDADARTLVRRLHLDLIGLPPTPEAVAQFITDYERHVPGSAAQQEVVTTLVDRLLASPQYGERWARHWLDVARYADTQGETGDMPVREMWKYRNWVIDALNRDLPIDEFIRLQIAGDVYAKERAPHDPAAYRELVIPTGFIAAARRYGNSRADLHLAIEDTLDTLGRGVLGLTLRCARCHDHKFDPVTARDYYALYGIFQSTRYPWAGTSDFKMPVDLVALAPGAQPQQALDDYWKRMESLEQQIRRNGKQSKLAKQRSRYQELETKAAELAARGEDASAERAEMEKLLATQPANRDFLALGIERLRKERDQLGRNAPPAEIGFAVIDQPKPANARIHRKGDPKSLGPEVPRGFIEVIPGPAARPITQGSGRRELAEWITDPAHPLTARVFVNRIWQHHFGAGLVLTSDNFGRMGEPPSHPELLDWLAATFVEDGWSLKKLNRRIVLSRAYQLASDGPASSEAADPTNRFVWRHQRRLLDAETVRDSLLFVSGALDLSPGEAHPFPPLSDKNFASFNLNRPFAAFYPTAKRSVYVMTPRLRPHPELDLFNGPDRNASTSRRTTASITTQALFLLNSPTINDTAARFAERIATATDDVARIQRAFQLTVGRDPDADELAQLREFLARYQQSGDVAPRAAWNALSKVILNANEFFFLP